MNSLEVSIFIATIAEIIVNNYDEEDADVLGSMFNQLGDTINTVTAIKALGGNNDQENSPKTPQAE